MKSESRYNNLAASGTTVYETHALTALLPFTQSTAALTIDSVVLVDVSVVVRVGVHQFTVFGVALSSEASLPTHDVLQVLVRLETVLDGERPEVLNSFRRRTRNQLPLAEESAGFRSVGNRQVVHAAGVRKRALCG